MSKFCSAACRNKVGNDRQQAKAAVDWASLPPIPCAACGKPIAQRLYGPRKWCGKTCANRGRMRGGNNGHRRAKKFGVASERVDKLKVFERDGWRCQICGTSTPKSRSGTRHANAPQLDHRIPLSTGGPNTYDNAQCSCRRCNAAKAASNSRGQMPLFQVVAGRRKREVHA